MRNLLTCLTTFTLLIFLYACQKEVSVEYGQAAKGSLQSSAGDCLPKVVAGTYAANKPLNDSNFIEVTVNVASPGPYVIFTDSINGYSFKGTGTFANSGSNTVRLKGSGMPLNSGSNNFTVVFDSSFCDIAVTVTSGTPPPGGCTFTLQGTYVAGTAVTTTNKVVLTHTYAAAGNYSVSTNTVNGYSFGPKSITATAGSNSITLDAVGTPAAAGTNTFTVNFGDGQTCTFSVTVTGTVVTNNDYFPMTTNSYWTYNYGTGAADTFKMTSSGTTTTLGANTYNRFNFSGPSGPFTYEEYYRKTATAFYYQGLDTAYWRGTGLLFTQRYHDILFLKNTLATADSLVTDYNAQLDTSSTSTPAYVSIIWRYKFKVINANATIVVNGKTFTNAYHLRGSYDIGYMGFYFDSGLDPTDYYYVRGVGRVQVDYGTDSDDLRYWVVN